MGSSKTELERAEALLRRSVKIDPRAPDARVRLGRVLSLQTRYADALTELRQLDASAPQMLQYYAALFTGDAAEALGRRYDARGIRAGGDTLPAGAGTALGTQPARTARWRCPACGQALEDVLSATSNSEPEDDPFWTYHRASGRDTATLLAQAYRALSEAHLPATPTSYQLPATS